MPQPDIHKESELRSRQLYYGPKLPGKRRTTHLVHLAINLNNSEIDFVSIRKLCL